MVRLFNKENALDRFKYLLEILSFIRFLSKGIKM